MRPEYGRMSRRSVLLGLAGAAATAAGSGLLAACGGGSSHPTYPSDVAVGSDGTPVLLPQFDLGDPYLVTGSEQRMVFGLQAKGNQAQLAKQIPSPVTVTIRREDHGRSVVGRPQQVVAHSDGTPVGYYPVRTTFPAVGTYSVEFDFGGGTRATQAIQVATPAEAKLVQRGQPMRPFDTPTPTDHRGVEPICTRSPVCHFHLPTLTQVLATGKPTAFLIATPEFCQVGVCGPSLDLLIDVAPRYPTIQFLHAEVYQNAAALGSIQGAKLAPVVIEYNLSYEPVLFAADAHGSLVDRLDNIFDRSELRSTLDKIA
jgi:hypothetical protein